jgi:cobalt-zinc-cadmium resistance protein CzcA
MLNKIFEFSLHNRFLTVILTLLIIGAGIYSMQKLPIDAVPDVTPVQVQILTNAPGLGPVEVEKFITFPVETAMSGLPGIERIRSISRFGLSAVTIYFNEGTDIYFARRLVLERLPEAREAVPQGFGTPEMGPISTGLGEIYQFEVKGTGYSSMDLRSILEWDIAFKLKAVPGVVEVNAWGGELKTYQVSLDASRLVSYKIPLDKVFDALQKNNTNAGGAYIIHGGEQYVIRGEGLIENVGDIENIIVDARNGTPIYVKNIGKVTFAPVVRQGAVTRDGRGEAVTGFVMMLIGENSREVVNRVKEKVAAIQKSLPPGVTIEPYYDRTELVKRTITTVSTNLIEGGLLVIGVLLLLLGNLRAGLIVASAIPLSMLVAFTAMLYSGVSGNLMSLGAIDFGLVVDGAVLMIENIVRHLREKRPQTPESHTAVILEAGREVIRPIFFAVGIIIIVYLPILTLQGIEGKLFRPMAITVIFALTAALIISLTVVPVLASFFLKEVREKETFVISGTRKIYTPALKWGLARPGMTAAIAAAVFALSALLVPFMGAEFIPRLEEGSLAIQASRIPSISLEESVKSATVIEKTLKRFPEVETVVSRTGRAEIATDPMGVETSDVYVGLKPKEEWKTASSREGLIASIDKALEENAPGLLFSYSQPIELRYQELIAGVRSDVAVNIFGDDLKLLKEKADEVVRVVSRVRGAADSKAEQVAGLSYLRIKIRRDAIARYGINASEVLEAIETVGGKELGQVLEGNRRFALQVRFEERDREDIDKIRNIRISAGQGKLVPLAQLADILVEEGPAQISRENVQRRIAVETNVRGRDLAGFVAEAQAAVEKSVTLPQGYWIEWGGQFENLQRASERLTVVVPLALLLIFVLLYMTFSAVGPAALIFLNVPLAATGGIFSLFLRGMPFSISAGVGFIAVFGVAVMNGIVLIAHIIGLRKEGLSVTEAVMRGTEEKMRAMIMAPAVAALGFVPMAISTGAGAEVQRPLATVVIGGIVTSTLLTLIVLPSIYAWMERKREARESRREL